MYLSETDGRPLDLRYDRVGITLTVLSSYPPNDPIAKRMQSKGFHPRLRVGGIGCWMAIHGPAVGSHRITQSGSPNLLPVDGPSYQRTDHLGRCHPEPDNARHHAIGMHDILGNDVRTAPFPNLGILQSWVLGNGWQSLGRVFNVALSACASPMALWKTR